jgi:hypothetical protein
MRWRKLLLHCKAAAVIMNDKLEKKLARILFY